MAKRLEYARFGEPRDVLDLVEDEPASPQAGEVRLQVEAAPINPSDLLTVRGTYGSLPKLPAVPGNEGVGRVVELGADVSHLDKGDLVLLPIGSSTWRSEMTVPAKGLFALSPEVDPLQSAMLHINPITASLLLSEMAELKPGDWVVLNAGNSAVGHYLITLARRRKLRAAAIVRRNGGISRSLRELGATVVIVDQGQDIAEELASLTGGDRVALGLDAVGGAATRALAACVDNGGTVVNYGAMAEAPCEITPQDLIFRNVRLVGFWLTQWLQQTPPETVQAHYAELLEMIRKGELRAEVAGTYPIEHYRDAIQMAENTGGRNGKILLTPDGPSW